MKLNTYGSLFEHACQIKDMTFSGFSPTTLRYTCRECGGHLVLRLDRDRWEETFGEKPSFRLSKKVLQSLDEIGEDIFSSSDEGEAVDDDLSSFSTPQKFHWEPEEEVEGAEGAEEEEEAE